jgi:adenosylcobinamide kinase/adenosylcobinamide-phosphate guanylyltransferase
MSTPSSGTGRIVLVGGGARSGKSTFALALARRRGPRRLFIATAQAFDAEMHARIEAHALERGTDFDTLEAPRELTSALRDLPSADVVVIDCITLWLSNLLLADHTAAQIRASVEALCEQLSERRIDTILVTNEVGMGIVPDSALGRAFRDIAGLANQRLSAIADELYWAMLGSILQLRPEPLRVHTPWSPP